MRILGGFFLSGATLILVNPGVARGQNTFPVASVIAEVKKELLAAQNTGGPSLGLPLQSVQLTIALSSTTDVNGKIAIGVPMINAEVGATGDRKAENTSTLTVELAPPAGSITMSGADIGDLGLTQAIISTRNQLAKSLNDEPKLIPRKVSIQIKFSVTRSGGGTGQIKFLVLTVGGGVTKSVAETNTITLTYEKAAPKKGN